MPLKEENGWLPDIAAIPADVARKAKVMWLNYPNNPTGSITDLDYFEKAIAFAREHDLVVIHDNSYSEVAYDGYRPVSFLQASGALDVGMEIHSLSKSYNMTGWRIGMAVGNPEMINALMVVKSNLDSGIPQAIQRMGIEALDSTQEFLDERNSIYQSRRDRVLKTLAGIDLHVDPPQAGLYIWARIPPGYTSAGFTAMLLEERDIVVTPGSGYGPSGEGYIRLSLTIPNESLEKGLGRLSDWSIPPAE